jgi:hypothetical protein
MGMERLVAPAPMRRPDPDLVDRQTFMAHFEDGPRRRTFAAVLALESGQAPDVLLTPGQPDWIYVRAGAERRDGSLPYMHMPPSKVARLRARGQRVTEEPGA